MFCAVSWLNTQMVNGVTKQKENIVQPEEPETENPRSQSHILALVNLWSGQISGPRHGIMEGGGAVCWTLVNVAHKVAN